MNKKLIIILAVAASFILGAATYAAYTHLTSVEDTKAVSSPPPSEVSETITFSGIIVCLIPKDTSGATDSSCAIGLKADDGKSYALNAEDPTLTGSVLNGERVKIRGTFTEQSSKYDIFGLIKVISIERE